MKIAVQITKETVKAVVAAMKAEGKQAQEIENNFKAALKAKLVGVDVSWPWRKSTAKAETVPLRGRPPEPPHLA